MEHEDGYCDSCGAEADEAWLTVQGEALCRDCATGALATAVRVAARPEARDDGR
jgi:hypothetical protein